MGNILQGAIPKGNNKALFIYGHSSNGKSEFLKIIRGLLHHSQVGTIKLSALSTQTVHKLKDKLLAIEGDSSGESKRVNNVDILKEIVTGDPTERKKLYKGHRGCHCEGKDRPTL